MTIDFKLVPIISLIAGIVILIVPKLLNYIVAIYLIVIDVVGCSSFSGPFPAGSQAPYRRAPKSVMSTPDTTATLPPMKYQMVSSV
jgi:hypothetical protein